MPFLIFQMQILTPRERSQADKPPTHRGRRPSVERRSSYEDLEILLSVPVSINGRLGMTTSTTLIITKDILLYARCEVALESVEEVVRSGPALPC